jgi:hypothetical protein
MKMKATRIQDSYNNSANNIKLQTEIHSKDKYVYFKLYENI